MQETQHTLFYLEKHHKKILLSFLFTPEIDILSLVKQLEENTSALALMLHIPENNILDFKKLSKGLKQNIKVKLIEIYVHNKKSEEKLPPEINQELDANTLIWQCMNYINKNKKFHLETDAQQIIIDKILRIEMNTAHQDTLLTISILINKLNLNIPEKQKENFRIQVENLEKALQKFSNSFKNGIR